MGLATTASVTRLATWVGEQIKSVRAALPAFRSKTVTTSALIGLGTPTDLTITWDTPLPDAAYFCWVQAVGTAGLGSQVAAAVKSQTKTGCVVTLRSGLALAAGYQLTAYAIRLPNGAANA